MTAVLAIDKQQKEVEDAAQQQYLTFIAGGEVFAVEILRIKEIIEYGSLTGVPMMPAFIRGVINLRGAVVPVIDLAARFGGAPTTTGRRTCIVIIEVAGAEDSQDIGVMVDAVNEVLEIPSGNLEPAPTFGTPIKTDFIGGMGRVDDRFIIILEVNRVLCIEEMAACVETGGSSSPGMGTLRA